jgi:hypothetical protein
MQFIHFQRVFLGEKIGRCDIQWDKRFQKARLLASLTRASVLDTKSVGLDCQLGLMSFGGTRANGLAAKPSSIQTVDHVTTYLHPFSDIY